MALHSAPLLNRGLRQLGNGLFDVLDVFTLPSTEIKQLRKVFTRKAFFHFLYVLFGNQVWRLIEFCFKLYYYYVYFIVSIFSDEPRLFNIMVNHLTPLEL